MIVDCFTYYNEEELLEFRINLYKDYVDMFVIMEGDRSYTGIEREFSCRKTLEKLGLLEENKILILEVALPKDGEPDMYPTSTDITYLSRLSMTSKTNILSATRERILRGSLQKIIESFSEDDVFIFSDCDEFIKPEAINYFSSVARSNKEVLLKVPLITLEGRADLRLYDREDNPLDCNNVMFVCTKEHITKCSPFNLRFNIECPYPEAFLTQEGAPIKECGWHFTWMGNSSRKIKKLKSFSHHADYISFAKVPDLSSQEMIDFLKTHKVEEGTINPWGNLSTMMKKYPIEELPKIIFDLPRVRKFLFNETTSIPVIGTAVVNGVHWLERMIASIDYPVDELFIVNNNGREQITQQLEEISNKKYEHIGKITISHMPGNIGCAAAWNLTIKSHINAPYWIIVNPDIAFTEGFLQNMLEMAEDLEVGMVNASAADHGQGSFECFLIKDWLVQSHGLFDENFYPAYLEDTDYIMRMIAAPVKRAYMNYPFLHGEVDYYVSGSQTWRTEPELKNKIDSARIKNETEYMTMKWGDWIHLNPWKTPFNKPEIPVSYTTFDLNFSRRKHLGF